MSKEWDEQLILSKYHLSVAQRMFNNFSNYETKRFLSTALNELALSTSSLVNASLIYFHKKNNQRIPISPKARIEIFKKNGEKTFNKEFVQNTLKIFEIKKAQKNSPIEFLKKDKIILLDNGKYKTLTTKRLNELLTSLENNIKQLSEKSKED
jgi:hypothetical protein